MSDRNDEVTEADESGLTREELEAKLAEADNDGLLGGVSVPTLFSSFLEAEEVPFHIGDCKKESTATLRPMNADQLARYKDTVSRFSTVEGKETKFFFEPSTAEADLALLIGTVERMEVFYDKKVKGGEGTVVEQFPFPRIGPARVEFFQKLHPELRGRLVRECKKVNGLHPLSQK